MKSILSICGLGAGLLLASVANATVTTWSFGGNPAQVNNGSTYCPTYSVSCAGQPTITVFGEQVNSSQNITSSNNGTTIDQLFQVNNSVNQEGIGIAPYDPAQGTSGSFANQLGISDYTGYDNILEVELGSNIAKGTSLAFLLQAGIGASSDYVTFYTEDTATGTPVSPSGMSNVHTTTPGQISTLGTTPQYTLVKDTSGIEFVAIEADCHYILLDTVTGTSPVPEPRFYGILLAGLLGLAGMVYQRRRAAQTNA